MKPLDEIIDENFVLRLSRGEPWAFEGQLEDVDGNVEPLAGRTFFACVMSADGTRLREAVAEIYTDRSGFFYRGVIDGSMSDDLFGQSNLLWWQGERTEAGNKPDAQGSLVIYPGPGMAAPDGPSGIAAVATRFIRRATDTGRARIRKAQAGARGPSPWDASGETLEAYNARVAKGAIDLASDQVGAAITELGETTSEKIAEVDDALAATAIDRAATVKATSDAKDATALTKAATTKAQEVVDASPTIIAARDQTLAARDQAAANAALPANNSNPNLWADPDLEYQTAGAAAAPAWSSPVTVEVVGGAKRLRTPVSAAALAIFAPGAYRFPASAFPNGRASVSMIVAARTASAPADLRARLYAYDGTGKEMAFPDYTGADENAGAYYSRYMGGAAITQPTEVVLCQNVQLPAGFASVGIGFRVENSATMAVSAFTIRNGADPHYRAAPVSPKQVGDVQALALLATASTGAVASALAASPNNNVALDPELENAAVGDKQNWGGQQPSVVVTASAKRLRVPVNAGAIGAIDAERRYPVSLFPNGRISASMLIASRSASAAADLRVRLYAYDAGGAQLLWPDYTGSDESGGSYYSRYVGGAALSALTPVTICQNVQLPAGTATVGFGYRSDASATMDFSHLTLRNGADASYRVPFISPKTIADIVATLTTLPSEDAPDYAAQMPNRFLAAELDVAQPLRLGVGTVNVPAASTYGTEARPCWSFTAPAGAATELGTYIGNIPRAQLDNGSGRFSMAMQVYSLPAYAGAAAAQTCRILVVQRNAANAEVGSATHRVTKTITGAVNVPTWFREASIAVHADCAFVVIYIGILNVDGTAARTMRFGDMLLAPGGRANFRRPPVTSGAGGAGVVYVDPAGADNAAGTIAAPVASLQAAVNKLGGAGTIVVAYGTYMGQRIDPATVTGRLTIIGRRAPGIAYDSYPVINLGTKVTGITKTAGFTKVYEATVAGLPTLADFNWCYQADVADPRTLIAAGDRMPHDRGRLYRMPWGTKLVKTTATTLAAAQAEIDGSDANDPRAFIDDSTGKLYFSIVGGGDATAANICLDGLGFFSAATRESVPQLDLIGLEIRYGGINTEPFRSTYVNELFLFGARSNCFAYSVLRVGTLECAAAGSQSGLVGDGLNGHLGPKLIVEGALYAHDCRDDGFSDHEGGSSHFQPGSLCSFNGGTAFAPAYGSDCVITGATSLRNQRRVTNGVPYKAAAYYVTGGPLAAGAASDGGADTLAIFKGCISIGDFVGFADDGEGTPACRAVTIDCKVYDQIGGYGYNVAEMRDCTWSSATGAARKAGRASLIKNTALVA